MDWLEEYHRKVVTADEAVSVVKSGDLVVIPMVQFPRLLPSALAKRKDKLRDVEILTAAPVGDQPWYQAGWDQNIRVNVELFTSAIARSVLDEKLIDYSPNIFSIMFKPFDERRAESRNYDVCIVVVSPPDKNGYCSFGPQLWTKKSFASRSKTIIAEVDPNMIKIGGDSFIHMSEITHFVEIPAMVRPALAPAPIDESNKPIADFASTLIKDGDTIQIGLGSTSGSLPSLGLFQNLNDLGVHTELTVAGMAAAVRNGIITGKYKTIHNCQHIATAWSGTEEDMAFMDGNPTFQVLNAEYVINIKTIAAHDNMVAINNAISVDLSGSICSESIGTRVYNGSGGQTEFHIGAVLSKGGRAITVLPSTALMGTTSRIVPFIQDGSYVTIPRTFADAIVTEYGIANLLGKTQRERAEALIAIAHPDFRDELRSAARKMLWP